ncbi:type I polyketide synthase [Streptomyces qinglanensis]|uniref:Acyl transferase domain-containing protein n=1 Tax=Streptomyces qinglanensis TaxID=943816 RepID=A0A1H9NBC5_9ACTN|nr:type I polyketide synthase [Streptomyces qinglanensis]SER33047.1 Acyl transferase domain-containing protein [Streptomyces qinglanensis]
MPHQDAAPHRDAALLQDVAPLQDAAPQPGAAVGAPAPGTNPRAVAVVGLDCAFPGAPDPDGYWRLLNGTAHAVGAPPPSRFRGAAPGAFLADADAFDPGFLGIPTAEATAMDPQQRLLLQCAWRAVEDSGLPPSGLAGSRTGSYVGAMSDDWARLALADPAGITPRTGTGSGRSMLANRLAYQFDLRGPSLTVDTACSSSLVAVHLACTALQADECDLALACGVNIVIGTALDRIYRQAGLAAADGRCKPFAAEADGIGRGEGVGVVVLRRLDDAVRRGDPVYAVLHGSAVNQDGRSNGIMAPHRAAQRDVVTAARLRAGAEPGQIRYVEAHGTGTALGDLIEVLALDDALGARQGPRTAPLAVGSAKSAVGHTEGAAGMAGLVKAVLAVYHGIVPPGPAAGAENQRLGLARRRMELVTEPLELAAHGPGHRVGVSSFGMGGTNAHLVLGPPPRPQPQPQPSAGEPLAAGEPSALGVFTLSADTPDALRDNLRSQAAAAAALPERDLAALCRTSNRVRAARPVRFAAVAGTPQELAGELRAAAEAVPADRATGSEEPAVAFVFTGQGSQHPGMTAALYAGSPLYRGFLREASAALRPWTGEPVHELLLSRSARVHRASLTQPALFAVEYALAAGLRELGVRPCAVLGHGIGEFAAAVVAGGLELADAARLVARRGALMEALPAGGGMLATRAAAAEAQAAVADEPQCAVAAVDAPGATVLSGTLAGLARIRERLARRGLGCTPLPVPHAFHSPLMEPVLDAFADAAAGLPAAPPRIPFHSTVHGGPLPEGAAPDAAYWTAQIPATVRFADAVGSLCADPPTHLVEIGPQPVLAGLLRRITAARGLPVLTPCRGADSGPRDLAEVVARLYEDGLDSQWERLYAAADRRTVRMAPHVFATRWRSWRQPPTAAVPVRHADGAGPGPDTYPDGGTGPRTATGTSGTDTATGPGTTNGPAPGGSGGTGTAPRAACDGGTGPGPHGTPRQPSGAELPAAAAPPDFGAGVRAVVAGITGGVPEELGEDVRFYDDLGFDSVMLMELKHRLEVRFPELGELSLPEMIAGLVSIGSLTAYLRGLPAPAAV